MNRSDFQTLAEIRLREAKILLDNSCFGGAYYLCGYAIECGLKACIAKNTKEFDFPPDRKAVEQIYKHKPLEVVKAAGLEKELETQSKENKVFADNWEVAKDWSEEARYKEYNEKQARDMYNAVSDANNGVLQWVKTNW
jgi:hypothetical protein